MDNTLIIHEWMRNLPDKEKLRFALNWKMPHSLLNVANAIIPDNKNLQNVDWHEIHKSRDLGTWSHGGRVKV